MALPCLKLFAGANAVWSLRQISPQGHQPNLVDLTSHANVNQNIPRLLCITKCSTECRMEGGATVQQLQCDKLVEEWDLWDSCICTNTDTFYLFSPLFLNRKFCGRFPSSAFTNFYTWDLSKTLTAVYCRPQSSFTALLKDTLMVVAESFQNEICTNNFPVTSHFSALMAFSARLASLAVAAWCFVLRQHFYVSSL